MATFDSLATVIAAPGAGPLFADVKTVIVDDAHSQLEPETWIILANMNPSQLILVGTAEELPRALCHSVDNCMATHFNKSVFTRMIEREYSTIEVKY